MIGAGSDPHLYRPTASDVDALSEAELILYVGLNLEGQLGAVLERFSNRKPTRAVAEEAIDPVKLVETVEGGLDPHVWMDAALWAGTIPVIADAITIARPDCAAEVAANAERYAEELTALDAWIGASIATIPEDQRVLVTAHDAFEYFGRAYELEVVGVQGISTESEASIADIRATAQVVVDRGIPAVFVESTINPRTVEALIDAAGSQGHVVRVGGELYSDAMGEDGTASGTYIGMLHANATSVTTALGGTLAPLPQRLLDWAERWGLRG
jgi:manganese/zinc/iron transport system substrate-binding protein